MSITAYAKAHPWATGTIVVVGGLIFLIIVKGGSGGASSSSAAAGPSDAQVAADAAVQVANIQAQAAGAQAGAAVQAAQIGAGVQMNSDNKTAEQGMAQIAATKDIYDSYFASQADVAKTQVEANSQVQQAVVAASSTKNAKNSKVASILSTVSAGTPVSYVQQNQSNYGNSAAGIIGSVGSVLGTAASIFSDARLKENIRHIGYDEKGRDVYEFNYRGSKKKRIGYIAQSIQRSEPELVHENDDGYLKVNYYG